MSRPPLSGPEGDLRAYIGLGGNVGDPGANMTAALRLLDSEPGTRVVAVSSLYRTPPWGKTDQPDFLNACAALETDLPPIRLLKACLAAERKLKRIRRERWGPRAIDIDILVHWAGEHHGGGLTLPHPRMGERAFVLVPLAEIAPGLEIAGRRVSDLAREADATGISIVSGPRWWRQTDEPG